MPGVEERGKGTSDFLVLLLFARTLLGTRHGPGVSLEVRLVELFTFYRQMTDK